MRVKACDAGSLIPPYASTSVMRRCDAMPVQHPAEQATGMRDDGTLAHSSSVREAGPQLGELFGDADRRRSAAGVA